MNLVVCIKQILDPEIPARDFRIDAAKREAEQGGANLVANIFCENALETALQAREAHGGKLTALALGPEGAEDVLRKALALKADEAVLVVNEAASNPDPLFVARTLAAREMLRRGEGNKLQGNIWIGEIERTARAYVLTAKILDDGGA
jgi:electron transfer flavoprotein beta subunit